MRHVESSAARSAGAIVTLAAAVLPVLAERHGQGVLDKIHVITTCVDLDRFRPSPQMGAGPVCLLLSGTLNRRYDVPTMVRFAERFSRLRAADLRVLSPAPSPWDSHLRSAGAAIASARPAEMPDLVRASSAGLSLLRKGSTSASTAQMPTKLGEFLACGRPVVTSPGLGDMSELLRRFDCGVVLAETTDAALDEAALGLVRLLDDQESPARCRALAEDHFNIEVAVDRLAQAYGQAVRSR
jgi:glycosyltransferase involved in cell wall biosynthesis